MPELPEVETTRRGIEPHLLGALITEVTIRRRDLRQPVPDSLAELEGCRVTSVGRRSKYLLIGIDNGATLLIHLGMSGSLRLVPESDPWRLHDHIGISFKGGRQLRFHDPRRFGLVLYFHGDPAGHELLKNLGPEPLEDGFHLDGFAAACAKRSAPIKQVIMDAKVVVGVGNIYASEALFRAGIRPQTPARRLSRARLAKLVAAIREVLSAAILEGGTTLRDFLKSDGEPGYFRQRLMVYERAGKACRICGTPIRQTVMGQRSTYWCPRCQR